MRIKLDDTHILISEAECCWIVKMVKSKKTGKMSERRYSGYYSTIEGALHSYFDRHVNRSESTSITALRREIRKVHEDIAKWCDVIRGEMNE